MESNLHLNCEYEEAERIADHITIDVMIELGNYFEASHSKATVKHSADTRWNFLTALSCIYIAGYVSGVRAEKRKRL